MRRYLAVTLALVAALSAAAPARAQSGSSLSSGQDGALLDALRDADGKRQRIEESLARITTKLDRVQRELAALRPKVEAAEAALGLATTQLILADAKLNRARRQLGSNALELYATAQWNDVLAILNADDLASVASAEVYIESVIRSNTAIVKGYRTAREAAAKRRRAVEAKTAAVNASKLRLEAREAELLDAAEAKQQAANQLTAALVERAEALGAIGHDGNGFVVVSRSFGRATDAIKLLVAASQQGQVVEEPRNGAVWWPVTSGISSPYGWRTHPIWKKRSFHTGIDIPAAYGSSVRAARAGTVLEVAYAGAFGLVTVVDHGNSVATVYAHQSRTLVRPGDRVQAGEPIGAVGCTGWCTGPHVHFEVWSRGQHTNPLLWL